MSMPASTPTVVVSEPPPIVKLTPYILRAGVLLVSAASSTFNALFSIVRFTYQLSPHHIVLPTSVAVAAYVFSPVLVLARIFLDLFVWTPWQSLAYFFEILYPLYVLCGVACILGGGVGLLGRVISEGLVKALKSPPRESVSDANENLVGEVPLKFEGA
ncbi:hypothetical protein HGRIS_002468 [Hohenbuehelia grisea]|uniref:Transmembrane protein n=1 Tax=Hohenbuehelia grisea TaxID=104357 RepID=A0ABR3JKJ7_9AGAR